MNPPTHPSWGVGRLNGENSPSPICLKIPTPNWLGRGGVGSYSPIGGGFPHPCRPLRLFIAISAFLFSPISRSSITYLIISFINVISCSSLSLLFLCSSSAMSGFNASRRVRVACDGITARRRACRRFRCRWIRLAEAIWVVCSEYLISVDSTCCGRCSFFSIIYKI